MSTISSSRGDERVVHVSGARPTPYQFVRAVSDVAVAVPLFATAPLLRHWSLASAVGRNGCGGRGGDARDELVPGSKIFCTRAIMIDAPPEAVATDSRHP